MLANLRNNKTRTKKSLFSSHQYFTTESSHQKVKTGSLFTHGFKTSIKKI